MSLFAELTAQGLGFLSSLFIFMVGLAVLFAILIFISDVSQTKDAIRKNSCHWAFSLCF